LWRSFNIIPDSWKVSNLRRELGLSSATDTLRLRRFSSELTFRSRQTRGSGLDAETLQDILSTHPSLTDLKIDVDTSEGGVRSFF